MSIISIPKPMDQKIFDLVVSRRTVKLFTSVAGIWTIYLRVDELCICSGGESANCVFAWWLVVELDLCLAVVQSQRTVYVFALVAYLLWRRVSELDLYLLWQRICSGGESVNWICICSGGEWTNCICSGGESSNCFCSGGESTNWVNALVASRLCL